MIIKQGSIRVNNYIRSCALLFDNVQIDDIRIPNGKYMGAEYKEVLCKSFPEIKGLKLEGGGSQFITNSQIKVNRLINLETGEIIKFSH